MIKIEHVLHRISATTGHFNYTHVTGAEVTPSKYFTPRPNITPSLLIIFPHQDSARPVAEESEALPSRPSINSFNS